jgi:Ca2+-binding EF-hand superfamily protein
MNSGRKTMNVKNINLLILLSALLSTHALAKEPFSFLDSNKDGKLSIEEFIAGLEYHAGKVKSSFNNDGKLIVEDTVIKPVNNDKEIRQAQHLFKRLDLNKDNVLDDPEYYPDDHGPLAFAAVDTNKDGKVSIEEIVAAAPPKRKRAMAQKVRRLDGDWDQCLDYHEYVERPYFEVELKEYAAAKAAKAKIE